MESEEAEERIADPEDDCPAIEPIKVNFMFKILERVLILDKVEVRHPVGSIDHGREGEDVPQEEVLRGDDLVRQAADKPYLEKAVNRRKDVFSFGCFISRGTDELSNADHGDSKQSYKQNVFIKVVQMFLSWKLFYLLSYQSQRNNKADDIE